MRASNKPGATQVAGLEAVGDLKGVDMCRTGYPFAELYFWQKGRHARL
jgi:hypothetical protein